MNVNIISLKDFLKKKKLNSYHILNKDNVFKLFQEEIENYRKIIQEKNQNLASESNQVNVFNKLLSKVYQYHIEVDIDKNGYFDLG